MSRVLQRPWLPLAALALSLGLGSPMVRAQDGAAAAKPRKTTTTEAVSRATPAKVKELESRMERKRTRGNKLMRFDKPREAVAFFVNKRTGPIETRGPNVTSAPRTLDPALYRTALEQARATPFIDSRTRQVLTPGALTAAAPGATLGTWESLGPNNQGGRTRQLLIDPRNPSVMYAAAVGGGVWKSTNAGASWFQLTDLVLPNIAVASLAMDPSNPQVLYAGTGEGFFNFDAIRGAGIFKSTDGGVTWAALAATTPTPGLTGDFSYVTQIVVSPRSPQRVYATTRTGLFRSNDGGASWTRLIDAALVNGCMDVTMQVKRAVGYVFAACGTFTQGAIHRGLDSNTSTFSQVFTTTSMGRTSLAIAPSNEAYVYAMSSSSGTGAYNEGLLGVFRSTANGNPGSWTTRVSNTNPNKLNTLLLSNPVYGLGACFGLNSLFNQGWYDNVIAVDPTDPEKVWAGGVDLFRSDDGGVTWGVASYWWFDAGVDPQYAHADQHVIRFHPGYNGTTNKTMYVANDGGIFRTNDARANVGKTAAAVCGTPVAGAVTWTEINTDFVTMQFYQGSTYPDGSRFFGGTQDNGTWRGTAGVPNWQRLLGGDGGYTAIDTLGDANASNDVLFGAFTGLSVQKSVDGGLTFDDAFTGIIDDGFQFIAPLAMNATNRSLLWNGGWFIWRTTNQAGNWTRASAVTPGDGSVSAVASAASDQNRVIVGMSDGYILYNGAALTATSATNWPFTRPRTAFVSSVAIDPNNALVAYAAYATFSGNSIYKSINGGASWVAVPGTGVNVLPRVPATAVVVDPTDGNRVYVGTDIGVYTTIDGGANWYRENTGFGNVSVESLTINSTGTRYLFAFTHGRGAWRVPLNP